MYADEGDPQIAGVVRDRRPPPADPAGLMLVAGAS
jgi:hypothetical protein